MMTNERSVDIANEVSARCLGHRTRMLDRIISGIYDRHLRPLGLRISQLTILTAIAKAGEAGPGELSQWLMMEKSTVSRTIDRMLANGWLSTHEAADGRSYRVRITRTGRDKLTAAHEPWTLAQQEVVAKLQPEGSACLSRLAALLNPGPESRPPDSAVSLDPD